MTDEIVGRRPVSRSSPDYYDGLDVPGQLDRRPTARRPRRRLRTIETVTIPIKSLLNADGIRFIFTSFVPNFAGFGVVAVIFVAMIGVGVAEEAG